MMTDPSDEVRDWATFDLGQLLDDDSAEIREALAARLGDDYEDVRYEAMIGLARRRDPRALPLVLSALQAEEVGHVTLLSAELLAHSTLLPLLQALDDGGDSVSLFLEYAVRACDPVARRRELEEMRGFLGALRQALDEAALALDPCLFVDVREADASLALATPGHAPDRSKVWSFRQLMTRAAGAGVAGAVQLVMGDLEGLSV